MSLLSEIKVSDIEVISNNFGNIVKIVKCDNKTPQKISEVYCSWIKPNKIKAWKKQDLQTLNLFVILGKIRFVFIDKNDELMKLDINYDSQKLITIPPGIWYGFMCISSDDGLILNSTDLIHNPDSVKRRSVDYYPNSYFKDYS